MDDRFADRYDRRLQCRPEITDFLQPRASRGDGARTGYDDFEYGGYQIAGSRETVACR